MKFLLFQNKLHMRNSVNTRIFNKSASVYNIRLHFVYKDLHK